MPELPEVETIRKGIVEKLKGKKISDVEIKVPKLFIGDINDIIGGKIIDAKRVAKVLQIVLDNGNSIIVHLKMTGQLIYKDDKSKAVGGHSQKAYDQPLPHAYTHITYTFSDGSHLYFNDFRKFGWNKVVKTSEIDKILGPDKYGPEPGKKEFTSKYLKKIFSKSNKAIKLVLMDQAKISGVGNIYANDGLYVAGIMPTRPAKSLSDNEISKLKNAIEKVLKLGLEYGGSSENTYVNIEGKKGRYMEVTSIYQKKTDPKGHAVKRITIGGRGTFYCDICQK
ncbi:MAG: Formamidopyrimidine-DNA glycosylase [Berkelbacteria bacterium GW2011_GWB1_38_5]|uniref:Formamidopyrimidine-DNA glycosylase n=2 Tax=Candidatus Berkelbacteria TaxID=1618330 RepID=A0A0G0NYS4_9BACT|nr:MAG: Formamidopyrimidine-DNA glycosylase [Berkelbacteria bacterium GW2011_GWB1_38_5]KKQ91029.1 MAG: Formamidopyrimidine-DNA glycosylase [Berkelbacteria bacterium GW2011_GWA1_39_10]